jgi:hypothetical protein
MALKPLFSVTPSVPRIVAYKPADPTVALVGAHLSTFGGWTEPNHPFDVQSKNDEIIIGGNAAPLSNTGSFPERYGGVQLVIQGAEVSRQNQYLLLVSLRSVSRIPTVQLFANGKLVRTERLNGEEVMAILADCPGRNRFVYITVVLASSDRWSAMGFKGIDGYLL